MRLPPLLHDLRSSLVPVSETREEEQINGPGSRPAAVLVLLYPRNGDVTFVLTARPHSLTRHPGQISLPGGMSEQEDRSLWQTALREAREELGLRAGRIVPLGRLEPVHVHVTDSMITPFVAWNPLPPRFVPDEREVAEVVEVPLRAMLAPSAIGEETWELRGVPRRVAFYRFQSHTVWGATALILHDLHMRLQPHLGDMPVRPGSVLPV